MDCDDTDSNLYMFASCTDQDGCTGYLDTKCACYVATPTKSKWWKDADNDTYGDYSTEIESCSEPAGYVNNGMDCDDTNPQLYMFAPCDIDGCTGYLNDKCECNSSKEKSTYWKDADGDTYGDPTFSKELCTVLEGWTNNGMDCNDTDANLYIGASCTDQDG